MGLIITYVAKMVNFTEMLLWRHELCGIFVNQSENATSQMSQMVQCASVCVHTSELV